MDIEKKTIKNDVKRLRDKLESFNFFRSRFEVPYRAWILTEAPKPFQDFYLQLKNDREFKDFVKGVNRHGSEKLTIMVVLLYAKKSNDDAKKAELDKYIELVYRSASGEKHIDKDYVSGKMKEK